MPVTQFHFLVGRNEVAGPMKQLTELCTHDTDMAEKGEVQRLVDGARLNGRSLRLVRNERQS